MNEVFPKTVVEGGEGTAKKKDNARVSFIFKFYWLNAG